MKLSGPVGKAVKQTPSTTQNNTAKAFHIRLFDARLMITMLDAMEKESSFISCARNVHPNETSSRFLTI